MRNLTRILAFVGANLRRSGRLFYRSIDAWQNDQASQLAAALAFYTVFSLAPLLILLVAVVGAVFGRDTAQQQVTGKLGELFGPQVTAFLTGMIGKASARKSLATVIGTFTLLLGSTVVFAELQTALNNIWGVRRKPGNLVWGYIRKRLLSFVMVLGIGALFLGSLVASTMLSGVRQSVLESLPGPTWLLLPGNLIFSFFLSMSLFAMIFYFLPDVKTSLGDIWIGAAMTSVLFNAGKQLISWYLGHSSTASPYGAAGSLFVFLLWVYYSAQIFFFGAEFTKIVTLARHGRIEPGDNAVRVSRLIHR